MCAPGVKAGSGCPLQLASVSNTLPAPLNCFAMTVTARGVDFIIYLPEQGCHRLRGRANPCFYHGSDYYFAHM